MVKMSAKARAFEKKDKASDKKMGIKEDSKKDKALDSKGVASQPKANRSAPQTSMKKFKKK